MRHDPLLDLGNDIIRKYLGKSASSNHVVSIFIESITHEDFKEFMKNLRMIDGRKHEYVMKNIASAESILKS